MTERDRATGAQVRGQIQSGKTGDIRPGFDPAAAPMETDAEAGGQPMSPDQARIAVEDHAGVRSDKQRNFDVAMRELGSAARRTERRRPDALVRHGSPESIAPSFFGTIGNRGR